MSVLDRCEIEHERRFHTDSKWFRSMTDEELANWLMDMVPCYRCPVDGCSGGYNGSIRCLHSWTDWLQQAKRDMQKKIVTENNKLMRNI